MNEDRKPRVAVAAAAESHVLESVAAAYQKGIADFTLFGDVTRIADIAAAEGLDISPFKKVDVADPLEAAAAAVAEVKAGRADALMKGLIETSPLLRAVLNKETGIRGPGRLSHLAMFDMPPSLYPKALYLTDAAVNIAPDLPLFKEIITTAVRAMAGMGVKEPKVALVCGKETIDPNMPITAEFAELAAQNAAGWLPQAEVFGPVALDCAVSPEAAATKRIAYPAAGHADLLVVPDLEAGNILYKALTIFAHIPVGSVILGAQAPIIISSRSDSSENKLLSIAIGAAIGATAKSTSTEN